MRFRFTQYLVAMRNAQRFLEEHQGQLASVNNSGARREFDASIVQLAALAEAQGVHRAEAQNHRAAEERSLSRFRRQDLQPLVEATRVLGKRIPDLGRPPRMGKHVNTTAVVIAARALADQVEAHRQAYIDLGFPDDFLNRFHAATEALIKRVADKGSSRVSRQQTTREIEQVVTESRRTLRVLDGLVEKVIDDAESPIRTAWQAALAVVARRAPATADEPAAVAPALKAA
jgi:hypothetical protein